jgi:hypothetical protein
MNRKASEARAIYGAQIRSRPSFVSLLETIAAARKLRRLPQFPERPDKCRAKANDRGQK